MVLLATRNVKLEQWQTSGCTDNYDWTLDKYQGWITKGTFDGVKAFKVIMSNEKAFREVTVPRRRHRTMASAIVAVCKRYPQQPEVRQVGGHDIYGEFIKVFPTD